MKQIIKRSLKFSLKEANTAKKSFLNKLWEDYKQIKCISCGFEADADYVGAVNILHRFLSKVIAEELTVPLPARPLNKCL